MTERDEFVAHLVDEDEELQAGISVAAFQTSGNEVVQDVRELLEDKYEVVER